jgi:hypothetical protein
MNVELDCFNWHTPLSCVADKTRELRVQNLHTINPEHKATCDDLSSLIFPPTSKLRNRDGAGDVYLALSPSTEA